MTTRSGKMTRTMTALTVSGGLSCMCLAAMLGGCEDAQQASGAGGSSNASATGGASQSSNTESDTTAEGGSSSTKTSGKGGTSGTKTTAGSTGGKSSTGSGGTSATSTATGPGIWAIINVDLTPANAELSTAADAKISGFPKNGPAVPDNLKETKAVGVCKLYTSTNPFCDPKCASTTEKCYGLSDSDGTCMALPTSVSMGNLEVSGLKLAEGGADKFSLSPINNTYESAGSTDLAYPPCAPGDEVSVNAGADDATKFTVKGTCIDPLELTGESPIPFEQNKETTVTWKPGSNADDARVIARFDISHHGGLKGLILCDSPDSGSVKVDGSLVTGLIQLGTAGYPVVRVYRLSSAEAAAGSGKAVLNIQSTIEWPLKVPGIDSCATNEDCATSEAGPNCTARKCAP